MLLRRFPRMLWLLAAAALAGCGGSSHEIAPVSGTVTVNGQPAENVFVQFEPVERESGQPSSTAKTDANGEYTLQISTPQGGPGAVVGEHIVRMAPAGGGDITTEGPAANAPPSVRLPKKATDGSMRFTVPPEGADSADFDL